MAQPYNKVNATTGDYRGAKAVLNERVIEGLEYQNLFSNGSDLQLTYNSPKNIILSEVKGYKVILPEATNLINGWTVFLINQDETNSLEVVKYADSGNNEVFKQVDSGKMIQCLLLDNSTKAGEWRLITTGEFEETELENKYTTSIYKTKVVSYKDLEVGNTKSFEIAEIPVSTPVKSIFIKPTEKFVGAEVYLAIGTEKEPEKFYNDIPLSVDVLDKNFTKDLFEEILSTTLKEKLYAKFYTKTNVNMGFERINNSNENEIITSFFNNGIYTFLSTNTIITSPNVKDLTVHNTSFEFNPKAVIYDNGNYLFAVRKDGNFAIAETSDFENYNYYETSKNIDFIPEYFVKCGNKYIVVSDYNVFSTETPQDTLSWTFIGTETYEAINALENIINVSASNNLCVISCNTYYFTTTDGINFNQFVNDNSSCYTFLNDVWISYIKNDQTTTLSYSTNFADWEEKDLDTKNIHDIKYLNNTWYIFTEPSEYPDESITISKDFFATINRLNTSNIDDYINSICGMPDKLVISGDEGLIAYSTGEDFFSLNNGEVEITVEVVKEINPMTIKNPILNINIPIGTIFAYPFADNPNGYVRLDGTIIPDARTLIPSFIEKIETSAKAGFKNIILTAEQYSRLSEEEKLNCGSFSWADEAQNNLRVPSINGFIRGIGSGSNIADLVGKYQTDTMRPITGTFKSFDRAQGDNNSGIFNVEGRWSASIKSGGGDNWGTIIKANSTKLGSNYFGSETQPKHVRYPYIMYVYNAVQNSDSIQLDSIFDIMEENQRLLLEAYYNLTRIQGEKSNIVRQTVNTASNSDFVKVISGLNVTCYAGVYGNCAQGYVNGIPFDIQIHNETNLNITLPTNTSGVLYMQRDITTNKVSLGYASNWVESWTKPDVSMDSIWYDTQFEKLYKITTSNSVKPFYAIKIADFSTTTTTATIIPVKLNYPGKKGFGSWQNIASTGTATEDGIIAVYSGINEESGIVIDGVQRQYISRRDKYGIGSESCTCPIAKGSSWRINGGSFGKFFIPLYSYRQGVNY
ncbi:MAG: hypothetical protein NC222_06115 [Staphylococcus sp.]|nr:hypothetical protein [Staphylococcus sp.]